MVYIHDPQFCIIVSIRLSLNGHIPTHKLVSNFSYTWLRLSVLELT